MVIGDQGSSIVKHLWMHYLAMLLNASFYLNNDESQTGPHGTPFPFTFQGLKQEPYMQRKLESLNKMRTKPNPTNHIL